MTKKELLQLWYDEIWGKGNLDMIDELFRPDSVATGIMPEMRLGPQDFRDLIFAVRQLVGDIRVSLPIAIEQGDWLSALIMVHTCRNDSGAPMVVTGQVIARFEGERMVETYNQFDFMSFFEQLGQFPPDTLPVCMAGQRLDWV